MSEDLLKNYFNKHKRNILPWVQDWTSNQNHIRYEKDVRKLSYKDWFFCHPSCFSLMTYGIIGIPFMTCLIMGVISFWLYEWSFWTILLTILSGVFGYLVFKKFQSRHEFKGFTFYDLWMKE